MLSNFYNWSNITRLNRLITQNVFDIKYILTIPKTVDFHLLNDLNQTFKRVFEIEEYMDILQKSKCQIIYLTLFTIKEKNKLGPIADEVSFKLIVKHLQQILKKAPCDVQIVGPNYLKPMFRVISYDTFLERFSVDLRESTVQN